MGSLLIDGRRSGAAIGAALLICRDMWDAFLAAPEFFMPRAGEIAGPGRPLDRTDGWTIEVARWDASGRP